MFSVNIDKLTNMTDTEKKSYQNIADTFFAEYGKDCPTLAVIGGGIKAFKIASSIMERGNKVLFIDGDLTCDVFLGKYKLGKNLKGVADYMRKTSQDEHEVDGMICATNYENLSIVFTGMGDDQVITEEEEQRMQSLLDEFQKTYDYIVVDSDNDGDIAKYCHGTLVVIDEGDYSELSADNLVDELDENGCKVLGVIINE